MRSLLPSHELTGLIISGAMSVHRALGPGFLESVYERALIHELRKSGLDVERQRSMDVFYDGIVIGTFTADLIVENCVIVENKAVAVLLPAHEAQLVHYLTATGLEIGLLLNFGSSSLQMKRKHRTPQANP
ncbi:MAG: GxxExxY protein [Blastocatellia bacterium]|jgi:GxxExxY protein|nr:GxxExxY protein [Blastocatellia bacterium]MBK6427288.1 GxxExxY protein [Blastocatellia bacterium]